MTEGKEEETQDQNKYGIMRTLTNPNRKEVPIDENEEELFNKYAEEIDQEQAELKH